MGVPVLGEIFTLEVPKASGQKKALTGSPGIQNQAGGKFQLTLPRTKYTADIALVTQLRAHAETLTYIVRKPVILQSVNVFFGH